jgi:hypothetical protein
MRPALPLLLTCIALSACGVNGAPQPPKPDQFPHQYPAPEPLPAGTPAPAPVAPPPPMYPNPNPTYP